MRRPGGRDPGEPALPGQAFDLDRIRIVRALPSDIEAFAIRFANDEDPIRRKRNEQAPCVSEVPLTEETVRIVGKTFGGGVTLPATGS